MPIETVSSMNQILKGYNSEDWSKSADMNIEGVKGFQSEKLGIEDIGGGEGDQSFSSLLKDSLGEVNELQKEADKSIQKLVTGESKNIHETMMAVEKAQIAFKTMNQVRQKVINAYREVMKMRV